MLSSPLGEADRRFLLRAAREAIAWELDAGGPPNLADCPDGARQPGAAFVTLRRRDTGALRGCRGDIKPSRPLVDSVVDQAIAAATGDCRFPPVTIAELPEVEAQISALTPLAPIRPDAIELGRHGLMIVYKGRSGLLLPQVPAHHDIRTVNGFLAAACRKAGLPFGAWWAPGAKLYGFEAETWGEGPDLEA